MLWSKQFYHYEVNRWLKGDPSMPEPPRERLHGRNADWTHLYNADVISMPDKWEYPWYAAWDLAFHCIPLALVDSDICQGTAHPDVARMVHASQWTDSGLRMGVRRCESAGSCLGGLACLQDRKKRKGVGDRDFLERVFHKLLLNFTWWVNRKDAEGKTFSRADFSVSTTSGFSTAARRLPTGGHIEQSDATSWMGMYCLNMLAIALELARDNRAYEDVASKFFEHFVYICRAMNNIGGEKIELWDREDGFFYDVLHLPNGETTHMKVRSMVGLIPLFAVETLDSELIDSLPRFKHRMQWFIENRPDFAQHLETQSFDGGVRRFLSLVSRDRLKSVLRYMLDEEEFLSPYGIRALSRYHKDHPYVVSVMGREHRVDYEPAESSTGLFGGNSNWRGPIWFPVNYLLIESLQKFHYFLGDQYRVECPTGSGRSIHALASGGRDLTPFDAHLSSECRRETSGVRRNEPMQDDPHWRNNILFYEYFHGDNGAGIGASHQTGWTGLVAKLIQQSGE